MWNTQSVQLEVNLPADIAAEARRIQESDPHFLERVILYGLTRRAIFKDLSVKHTRGSNAQMSRADRRSELVQP